MAYPDLLNKDFNTYLGKKLCFLRKSRNLSQGELGRLLGIRAQQIHKYETGENKLSAERLSKCAAVFGVSISYFYLDKLSFKSSENDELFQLASEFYSVPNDVRAEYLALIRKLRKFTENYQEAELKQGVEQ